MSLLERIESWFRNSEPVAGMVLGALVGAACGGAAIVFTELIGLVQHLVLGSALPPVDALEHIAWYWRIVVPVGGGLIVAPIVYRWAAEARGHGVPEVIEAVAVRGGTIRKRVASAKAIASAITIGTGGSVGREGPVVQIGAAIGSTLGGALRLSPEQCRTLVGSGAAAGIAATFNAPIAAAFFALEVILGNFAVTTFAPIVLASVVATAVSRAYYGDHLALQVPLFEAVSSWELIVYVGLGLMSGVAACIFIWLLYKCEDAVEASPIPRMLRPALGGAVLGLLLLALPQLYGSGFTTIERTLAGETTWAIALLLVAAKILATSVTLSSGGSGGVFSPSLFIGAAGGYFAGHAIGVVVPFETAPPTAYALVGMGAVLGGATHAPITSILMLFELTGDYNIILPTMLATTVSTITARSIMGESIYSMKLIRKGLHLLGGREETVMRTFRVRDVMRHHVPTVSTDTPLADIVTMFFDSPITELYVVDDEHGLCGVVSLHDVKEILTESSLDGIVVAHDLMVPVPTVLPADRLADCMRTFASTGRAALPVVAAPDGAPVGVITQRDLLDLYDREVLRREMLGTAARDTDRANALPAGHRLRSIEVPAPWVGKTLHEIDLRRCSGMTVISIKAAHSHLGAKAPDPERPLAAGDVLVVLGSIEASQALDRLLQQLGVTEPSGSATR